LKLTIRCCRLVVVTKLISAILLVLIIVGAIVLAFVFFRTTPKVKVLTINSEGKFDSSELKTSNEEVIKIKNEDDRKHTVRNLANNTNIVTDLASNETSGEIVFDDNSRNEIALADDKEVKASVLVGDAPATAEVKRTPATVSPPSEAVDTNGEPLPDTGPVNNYLYLLALLTGIVLFLGTARLLPNYLRKYLVKVGGQEILVHQPETSLIKFK